MQTTAFSTVSIKQKVFALKVIGNLGHVQSIQFVRNVIQKSVTNAESKSNDQNLPSMSIEFQLRALETIRKIVDVELQPIVLELLLVDCLESKLQKPLHLACTLLVFESELTYFEMQSFVSSLEHHDLIADATNAFLSLWERAIRVNDEHKMKR